MKGHVNRRGVALRANGVKCSQEVNQLLSADRTILLADVEEELNGLVSKFGKIWDVSGNRKYFLGGGDQVKISHPSKKGWLIFNRWIIGWFFFTKF